MTFGNVLYVSFQNDSLPRSCTGGRVFERHVLLLCVATHTDGLK